MPIRVGGSARRMSFKENKFMVAGIAGLLKNKLPFVRSVKRAAGQLPIHQVHFLPLVTICLDADILGTAADALDLQERRMQIVIVEIVQCIDGDHEVEMLV